MESKESLGVMKEVLWHCVQVLQEVVRGHGWEDEAVQQGQWQPLFGKESVTGALAKLVSMHKSLMEQEEQAQAAQQPDVNAESLSEQDWELLALCLQRRGGGGVVQFPSADGSVGGEVEAG